MNSALDDPLNYFQASHLSSRASDLNRLLDGIGQGIKVVEQADNGLRAITRLIDTAQGAARAALASPSQNAKIGSGSDPVTKRALDYVAQPNLVGPGGRFDAGDVVTVSGTDAAGAAFTFAVTLGAAPYTAKAFVDAINLDAANPGALPAPPAGEPPTGAVRARIDEAGRLVVDNVVGRASAAAAGTLRLRLTTDAGPTVNTLVDLLGQQDRPLQPGNLDTGAIDPLLNPTRRAASEQYNELLKQITNLAQDAGYNGVNLLYGQSLEMVFNEDSSTNLIVRGVVFDSAGLGLRPTDARYAFQSDFEIDGALVKLREAMKLIQAQATTFGSNMTVAQTRQSFTKEAVKTLEIGSDELVQADINEEGANLLALQTRQQLSTQALSLASQADQAVLRLFG